MLMKADGLRDTESCLETANAISFWLPAMHFCLGDVLLFS